MLSAVSVLNLSSTQESFFSLIRIPKYIQFYMDWLATTSYVSGFGDSPETCNFALFIFVFKPYETLISYTFWTILRGVFDAFVSNTMTSAHVHSITLRVYTPLLMLQMFRRVVLTS